MISPDPTNQLTPTASVSDPELRMLSYHRRKMHRCNNYDSKHYDTFNSTVLYPTESVFTPDMTDSPTGMFPSPTQTSGTSHVNLKRSHTRDDSRATSKPHTSVSTTQLDTYMRIDENRTHYELSKRAAVVHERLLHAIHNNDVESDREYDADYDNDNDIEMRKSSRYDKSKFTDDSSDKMPTFEFDDSYTHENGCFEEQIQLELQQFEEQEELEELELIEQLESMNI